MSLSASSAPRGGRLDSTRRDALPAPLAARHESRGASQSGRGVECVDHQLTIIKSRREFVHVQQRGQKFRHRSLLLIVAAGRHGESRVGLTTSRKVGNAVVRNRVRRRIKEILRRRPHDLCSGYDHVVIATPKAANADYATLLEELTCLLARAREWVFSNAQS